MVTLREQVTKIFMENPHTDFQARDIAERIGRDYASAGRGITKLRVAGLIERTSIGRNVKYKWKK